MSAFHCKDLNICLFSPTLLNFAVHAVESKCCYFFFFFFPSKLHSTVLTRCLLFAVPINLLREELLM